MIDFRYHIVSLIAVFLALALGLFLGSTTLQSTVTNNLRKQADGVTTDNRNLTAANRALRSQLNQEKALSSSLLPYALDERLPGETVAVVSGPGVDSDTRKAVESSLALAGADLTADVQLQDSFLDPTQDTELGSLAASIKLPNRTLPAANGATQASSVLAQMLVSRSDARAPSATRMATALQALSIGKFIRVSGDLPTRTADLAVLLVEAPGSAPSDATATAASDAQNTILVSLARDLRGASTGTVVAGPAPVKGEDGPLAAVRTDALLVNDVSTVDLDLGAGTDDSAAGEAGIVLSLSDAANGTVGVFGLTHNPPLPTPSPSISP